MNKIKLFISLILTALVLTAQVGAAVAAHGLQESTPITGAVQSITMETDANTGITTVRVGVFSESSGGETVRLSLETALELRLVSLNSDGNPVINELALAQPVEIDPTTVIPDEEKDQHPVGNALATFFSNITGLSYDTIMAVHDEGIGFGVIAQSLWLTEKLEGSSEVFLAIIDAKKSGDYGDFILEDGTTPKNWGQLRKAIMDGKRNDTPGVVMPEKDNNGKADDNGNGNGNGNGKDKDKGNNGNEKGNGDNKKFPR